MSEAETPRNTEALKPVVLKQEQVEKNQSQVGQVEAVVNNLLLNAKVFPVHYQPPTELLSTSSGRITLSIVRANYEKSWDVKEINARLGEDTTRTVQWIITPKKQLEPLGMKKKSAFDDDEDDMNLNDLMSPGFKF